MSTHSGTEFRAGSSATVLPDDMPEWAKSILWSQEDAKVQLEFLMTQLLELKMAKATEICPQAYTGGADSPPPPHLGGLKAEPHWDAAKKGAKPEVTTFDGSLDPKKYMDWEAGLDEYFDWYQLPEDRRIQFAQMKLTGQDRIYWQNLQATLEWRHEPMTTSWAEMKSRLREKFVPACYQSMILDEWQHLRQEEGTVADYIARFDDLMIRCNVDEEPMATLARFRAGLRQEFQREMVLHEVSTLERAYRYALNMEMYTIHNIGGRTPWVATAEVTRYAQECSRHPLPIPPPPVNRPISSTAPSPRLLLPTPSMLPSAATSPTTGNRFGASPGPFSPGATFSPGTGMQQALANESTTAGRVPQGPRTRAPPTGPSSSSARIACYKCQGWGHFAAQCPSSRQMTRPARALLVEIQDDEQLPPPRPDDVLAEIYEADPELAQAFEGSPSLVGCIIKEKTTLTIAEHSRAVAAPLGTMLSNSSSGGGEEARPITEDPLRSSIFSTFTRIGPTVVKLWWTAEAWWTQLRRLLFTPSAYTLGFILDPTRPCGSTRHPWRWLSGASYLWRWQVIKKTCGAIFSLWASGACCSADRGFTIGTSRSMGGPTAAPSTSEESGKFGSPSFLRIKKSQHPLGFPNSNSHPYNTSESSRPKNSFKA